MTHLPIPVSISVHVQRIAATTAAIAATITMFAGCTLAPAGDDRDTVAIDREPLYVKSSWIWSSPRIPVCWENPGSGNSDERDWVRDAVEDTWEAQSAVRFTGWNARASQ